METLSRRSALLVPVGIFFASLTQGCETVAKLPQYAQDVETVAAALNAILPAIQTLTGISASVVSKVTSAIATAQSLAAQIAAAAGSGASSVGALVSNFSGVFSTVASALGFNVPGIVGTVLQAGSALLPIILSAAGIALAGPPPAMPAAEARAILMIAVASK
jgi:phage-related protein